jgi:predicted transcriptional regulator
MQHEDRLLYKVGEIVQSRAAHVEMDSDDLSEMIKKVYKALRWVQVQEEKTEQPSAGLMMAWQDSIKRNKVICLECGQEFRQLTGRHLALHRMNPREYKAKHAIPARQSLSSKTLSAKRRRAAKDRGLGEKLRGKRST